MSVFGCHSCGVDITKYPDYMSSPCATCKLATEYYNTKRASMFDSAGGSDYNQDEEENEALARCDKELETAGDDPITKSAAQYPLTIDQLATLKKAIEDQLMIAISGILLKLLKLGQMSPVMLELVIKKMQYPLMSYSELGASMKEPFSKQNVLYHLKHAVEILPELSSALLTDTRFSGGRYALKTLAQEARQTYAEKAIQGILYGDDPAFQAKRLAELNAILQAPFLISKEALDFNPYIKDEKE
jgi:hypothetical protein